jgi:transaldolase
MTTRVCPEALPSAALDRSGHLAQLALSGYQQLAADTILNRQIIGKVQGIVGNAIRILNFEFTRDPTIRPRAYEVLIEIACNLFGVESQRVGFSRDEIDGSIQNITETLKIWEATEKHQNTVAPAAQAAISSILQEMKHVLMGRSMLAKIAEHIETELAEDNLMESFLSAMRRAIQQNVYYRLVMRHISKIGNDSATGLRRMRHLGAVQVSSNPVIAPRAYEEFPSLWDEFKEVIKAHPHWFRDPEKHDDEIANYGMITSLLPNLLVFRPVALVSNFSDGFVSYQLNPWLANSSELTTKDAMDICSILSEILEKYDAHLLLNTDLEGRKRPNIVFKVAACSPAAIEITSALNEMGIGTNNTVTFTVAQEVTLILAAMKGLSRALRKGIPITQVYETNMIGRLEDHLREVEAERLVREALERSQDKDKDLAHLATALGASEGLKRVSSIRDKITIVCSKKYLKSLTDESFVKFLKQHSHLEKPETLISQLEEDIEHAGIFVTRRVYGIFFSPENRSKWITYIQNEFGLTKAEAREVFSKIDALPSSKRRARDTYLVLGGRKLTNLTNTEFPDQQLKVWEASNQKGFRLSDFYSSIVRKPNANMLRSLLRIEDFRKAYELTPELAKQLEHIGIRGDLGVGGLQPDEWAQYGPVAKTMEEFKSSYLTFKQKAVGFVRKVAQEVEGR